jgi:hypothetical protein
MAKIKHIAVLFLLTLTSFGYSQMQTLNCTSVSICSCPGEVWNINNIAKPSVLFSAPGVSKRVMFSKYGFAILKVGGSFCSSYLYKGGVSKYV